MLPHNFNLNSSRSEAQAAFIRRFNSHSPRVVTRSEDLAESQKSVGGALQAGGGSEEVCSRGGRVVRQGTARAGRRAFDQGDLARARRQLKILCPH